MRKITFDDFLNLLMGEIEYIFKCSWCKCFDEDGEHILKIIMPDGAEIDFRMKEIVDMFCESRRSKTTLSTIHIIIEELLVSIHDNYWEEKLHG